MGDRGTGGYGAGLTRFLAAHTERVAELDRPKRAARRHGAKSDPLDATRAAGEALGRDQHAQPRAAGHRTAPSVRLAARRSAVQAATDAQRQLHALVVAAPDALSWAAAWPGLVATCGRPRQQSTWDVEAAATAASLRTLARRIQPLDAEVAEHTRAITTLVRPGDLSCSAGPAWARWWPPWSCVPGPMPAAAAFAMLGWGCADPRLQRPDGARAAESLWGPPAQPGPAPGRPDQAAP